MKIICLKNINFLKRGMKMPHADPSLEECKIVVIIFEYQKIDKRDKQIYMFCTNNRVLNLLITWSKTVQRIQAYRGTSKSTTVCMFREKGRLLRDIQADHVRDKLQAIVKLIGFKKLGFEAEDVGLHSVWSGGAIAMFLSGTSTIANRWKIIQQECHKKCCNMRI